MVLRLLRPLLLARQMQLLLGLEGLLEERLGPQLDREQAEVQMM